MAFAYTPNFSSYPLSYLDFGAFNHVTSDPFNLALSQPYVGTNQVMISNCNKLPIISIGTSLLDNAHDSINKLIMRSILHVPTIAKNLLSIAQLSKDNDVFFEFHATFYCVKDRVTQVELL